MIVQAKGGNVLYCVGGTTVDNTASPQLGFLLEENDYLYLEGKYAIESFRAQVAVALASGVSIVLAPEF